MKITIEKRIETLDDLRLARASLMRKAASQRAELEVNAQAFYNSVGLRRIYQETLDDFQINHLAVQLLPYALKYRERLLNNPLVDRLRRIDRRSLPYWLGGSAVAGVLAYYWWNRSGKATTKR